MAPLCLCAAPSGDRPAVPCPPMSPQVFASEEGDEGDVDETPDGAGAGLLTSRAEGWVEMCERKSVDFSQKLQGYASRLVSMQGKVEKEGELRAEENYQVSKILLGAPETPVAAGCPPKPP